MTITERILTGAAFVFLLYGGAWIIQHFDLFVR